MMTLISILLIAGLILFAVSLIRIIIGVLRWSYEESLSLFLLVISVLLILISASLYEWVVR